MQKTAVITGVAGQDGSYLTELLLSKDYLVVGLIRRSSTPETQLERIEQYVGKGLELEYGDVTDTNAINKLIKSARPNEVYNLAAQSQVWISYKMPAYTITTNALGILNVLDACKHYAPADVRFYQASSSEMFGNSIDDDGFQRETTPMHPSSPYGCSKVFGYNLTRHYRKAYGMFACNGICFNHASPRRGFNFLDSKVVKSALLIKQGKLSKITLGNMDAYRDWGHAKDYVRAMHMIVSHTEPDDFVIASGETHSVREFVEVTFAMLGLSSKKYVQVDESLKRAEEILRLQGDSTKARSILGWRPHFTFKAMIEDMIHGWSEKLYG